jgi:hypothetical protein
MPFKSKAQMRKFYSDPKLRKYADEFAASTPDVKALPERKKPMPKKSNKKWIQKAINPKHKGALKKKAQVAGMTTEEYIAKHKSDSGTTGEQTRLAIILMGMHPKKQNQNVKAMYRKKGAK